MSACFCTVATCMKITFHFNWIFFIISLSYTHKPQLQSKLSYIILPSFAKCAAENNVQLAEVFITQVQFCIWHTQLQLAHVIKMLALPKIKVGEVSLLALHTAGDPRPVHVTSCSNRPTAMGRWVWSQCIVVLVVGKQSKQHSIYSKVVVIGYTMKIIMITASSYKNIYQKKRISDQIKWDKI